MNALCGSLRETHVLVIDDEPLVLASLRRLLSSVVDRVTLASDAADAWRYGPASRIDLILLDVHLEGQSAAECLLGLRKRDVMAPAIVMSGLPPLRQDWVELPDAMRPVGFLQKPIARHELVQALHRAAELNGPRALAEVASAQ